MARTRQKKYQRDAAGQHDVCFNFFRNATDLPHRVNQCSWKASAERKTKYIKKRYLRSLCCSCLTVMKRYFRLRQNGKYFPWLDEGIRLFSSFERCTSKSLSQNAELSFCNLVRRGACAENKSQSHFPGGRRELATTGAFSFRGQRLPEGPDHRSQSPP